MKALLKWLVELFWKRKETKPATPTVPADSLPADSLPADSVASSKDTQINPLAWPATQDLKVALGAKLDLVTEAVKVWPDGGGAVCANLHFIVRRDGAWRSYCFDYVRPGQTRKKGLPRPPCKEGETYETVSKAEECHLYLSGLCRDRRRNVSERTNIVRVQ